MPPKPASRRRRTSAAARVWASGDMNPIHLSAPSAKLTDFRRAIAHGLWTKARALAAMLPRQPIGQAEVTVEFKTPLYLPGRASHTGHAPGEGHLSS
ncbi:MAG: hypothetical protein IPG16_19290 [Comamonadaceae bacterium]|nr:hypothetical protein [Comamonadaceae bacterium]